MPEKEKKKAEKERIVAAFATDSNYLYYTGVTLYTLLEHISSENLYHIVILSSHLSSEEQQFFQDLIQPYNAACNHVSWEYIDMEKSINEIGKENFYLGNYAIAIYYRHFLCSLLKNEKKIIYLDSDIVVKKDIALLWNTDMKGNAIAAAKDIPSVKYPWTYDQIRHYIYCRKVLNLRDSETYFNTGVLIMDLEKMRKNDYLSAVRKEILGKRRFLFPDQDIANRILYRKCTLLDRNWNFIPVNANRQHIENADILHFAGIHPWKSERIEFAPLWWNEAKKTPFYEQFSIKNLPVRLKYLEDMEVQYMGMLHSTSWHITKPVRICKNFINFFRNRIKKKSN